MIALILSIVGSLTPISRAEAGQWVKYSGNPILSPTSGGWDALQVLMPRLLYDSTIFRMWYLGLEGEEWKAGKIGYATSSDGITWTKHTGPVLVPGPSAWDNISVFPGSVVWNGSLWLMWYRGLGAQNSGAVGLATSLDGVIWSKYPGNPVMRDSGGTLAYPYVIKDGDTYRIWYAAWGCGCIHPGIYYATSDDGVKWTRRLSPVLRASSEPGAWDAGYLYSPTVVYDGSTYAMWYSASDRSERLYRIGYATSKDGISWTKSAENPILSQGPPGSWDGYDSVDNQDIVLMGNTVMLYYSADQTGANGKILSYKIGLAESPMGFAVPEMPLQVISLVLGLTVVATTSIARRHRKNWRS